jgi:thiamine biosynthesis lipoprotein
MILRPPLALLKLLLVSICTCLCSAPLALAQSASAASSPVAPADILLRESRYVMGTILTISLCGGEARRTQLEQAFSIAHELEATLSNYQSESELSLLNRDGRLLSASPALRKFLQEAKTLSIATRHSFDISIGPLLALWEHAEQRNQLPSPQELAAAREQVTSEAIHITPGESGVRLSKPGMALDSGGLGKGFAVDRIVSYLKAQQLHCALVDFGHSSSYALGAAPGDTHWRLEIKFPEIKSLGTVELRDQALSASHSFGRPLQIQGQRYGRIIDPRSGMALSSARAAIALSSSATEAEALSKALLLLDAPSELQQSRLQPLEYMLLGQDGKISKSGGFLLREGR